MSRRPTRKWWVCLCDCFGNVSHKPVGEYLRANRAACVDGSAKTEVPVALAGSLDGSQEAGRVVKREVAAQRAAQKSEFGDQKSEEGNPE